LFKYKLQFRYKILSALAPTLPLEVMIGHVTTRPRASLGASESAPSVATRMSEKAVPCSVAQRIIIKFLTNEGIPPSQILTRLRSQFGEKCLTVRSVYAWAKSFKDGRETVENQSHPRRPTTSCTSDNIARVDELIRADRRVTVRDVAEELEISVGSAENIVRNVLKYSKVSARWVPRLLQEEHKAARVTVAACLLERFQREGDDFLHSIVTCDETWVHHYTPESKRASMHWKHPRSPVAKKAKTTFSAGKVLATVFWDSKGILAVDFLTERRTINAEYYSTLLKEKVKPAIRNKRRKANKSVLFLHDNARPHTAKLTVQTLQELHWEVLPHPPYSPDLAPCDYYLFGPLKDFLGGRKFKNDEEVMTAAQEWLQRQPKSFYETGIKKLPGRWEKCITTQGDYVEK
jgi:[histone H3]-lysine36 N-dimethyltransferase SETMAR